MRKWPRSSIGHSPASDAAPEAQTGAVRSLHCSLGVAAQAGQSSAIASRRQSTVSDNRPYRWQARIYCGVENGRGKTAIVLLEFDGERKAVCRHAGSFPPIEAVLGHIDAVIDEHLGSTDLLNAEAFMGIGFAMPWFLGEWR
jgi:hypothetical protein